MSGQKTLATALLVVAVLTAGCGGLSGEGTADPTADGTTDGPETPGDATTGPDSTDDLPALETRSWSDNGEFNGSALFLAHYQSLANASGYAIETNITYALDNGSSETNVWAVEVEHGEAFTRTIRTDAWYLDGPVTDREYHNESRIVVSSVAANGSQVRYRSGEASSPLGQRTQQLPFADLGHSIAGGVNWTADGRTMRDGTPVYRYRGTGVNRQGVPGGTGSLGSAEMFVDAEGHIIAIDLQYSGEYRRSGETSPATVSVTVELSGVGETTVPTPEWVSDGRS